MRERVFITGLVVAVICGIAMAAYAQVTIPRTIMRKAPTPVFRDSDHDGVPNEHDQCPDSFYVIAFMKPGDVIDANGVRLKYPSDGVYNPVTVLTYYSEHHGSEMIWNFDTKSDVYVAGTGVNLKAMGKKGDSVRVLIRKSVIHPADGDYSRPDEHYGCSDFPGMP